MTIETTSHWLLFTTSLSGRSASTSRVRVWRALRELGASTLRDGLSVLPARDDLHKKLIEIKTEIESVGGSSWLFSLPVQDNETQEQLAQSFNRDDDYQVFQETVARMHTDVTELDEVMASRRLRQLGRDFDAIVRADFFPGPAQKQAREALAELTTLLKTRFSPQEPSASSGQIQRLDRQDYQGRLWATRQHLWVDRVASAWLVQNFIDRDARFLWLEKPQQCPAKALGFDFDGAAFSHVGQRVTFEVLLASFALEQDRGLAQLARLVHYLDVGGPPIAEAAGFEAILAGLRESTGNDDELLNAVTPILNALHQRFSVPQR